MPNSDTKYWIVKAQIVLDVPLLELGGLNMDPLHAWGDIVDVLLDMLGDMILVYSISAPSQ